MAQTSFFLGLTKQGSRIIKCWEPKVSRSGSAMAGGQRCCKQHPLPYWIHSEGKARTIGNSCGALEVSATDFWWWLQGLHRDLGFLPAPLCFSKSWGWMNVFERSNCTLKPLKQVAEIQLQIFGWLGTYKLVIFVFNVRKICKRVKITQILKRGEIKQRGLPPKLFKMLGAEKIDNLLLNLCPKS